MVFRWPIILTGMRAKKSHDAGPRQQATVPANLWRFLCNRSVFLPLAIIWAVFAGIVNPLGDFPLNDSWLYGSVVRTLVQDGIYQPHPFAAPVALAHIAWGALWCALLGFSFTVLRISTLVLGLVAGWGVARVALALQMSRSLAILCGLALMVNPVFSNLSFTYMTDVPFAAFTALACWWYIRSLNDATPRSLFIASVFAVLSFSIRQFGGVTLIAFVMTLAVGWFHAGGRPAAKQVVAVAFPWCAGLLMFAGYQWWLHRTGGAYIWEQQQVNRTAIEWLYNTVENTFYLVTYVGLFGLPLAIGRVVGFARGRSNLSRLQMACAGAFCAAATAFFLYDGKLPVPSLGNILRDLGLGPTTTMDVWYGLRPDFPRIGPWWWVVSIPAIVSGGLLVGDAVAMLGAVLNRERFEKTGRTRLFLALLAFGFFLVPLIPILPRPFDRYLLPGALAYILLQAVHVPRKKTEQIAIGLVLLLFGVYSAAANHDYLAWNRARWKAAEYITAAYGAPPQVIDGGFEYSGWHSVPDYIEATGNRSFISWAARNTWALDNQFYVGFRTVPGYVKVGAVPYRTWLDCREHRMNAYRRIPMPGSD